MISVYLDTQDISKFGDVIRGKSQDFDENIYHKLLNYRARGDVIFPVSMVMFSELMQYSTENRDICIAKAQAMENLCGPWAVPYPGRLMAMELAELLCDNGRYRLKKKPLYITDDRYWYPTIATYMLDDFVKKLRMRERKKIDDIPTKNFMHKRAKLQKRKKLSLSEIVCHYDFVALGRDLGVSSNTLSDVMYKLTKRKITSRAASKRLLFEISKPEKFIEVFFDREIEGAQEVPKWMSGKGESFKSSLDSILHEIEVFSEFGEVAPAIKEYWLDEVSKIAYTLLELGKEDLNEFIYGSNDIDISTLPSNLVHKVRSVPLFVRANTAYVRQVFGFHGNPKNTEKSIAGDLMHLLYLNHVDLWRGDRSFSALVSGADARAGGKIVSRLRDLPERIEGLLRCP